MTSGPGPLTSDLCDLLSAGKRRAAFNAPDDVGFRMYAQAVKHNSEVLARLPRRGEAPDAYGLNASGDSAPRSLLLARGEEAVDLRWRAMTNNGQRWHQCGGSGGGAPNSGVQARCFRPSPEYARRVVAAPHEVRVGAAVKAAWEAAAAEAVAVPGASGSALAATVQCAARLAQALAFERALPLDALAGGGAARSGEAGGSAAGGGATFDGAVVANSSVASAWGLFVLTDSPALASLVGRLPSLRGHVFSQGDDAPADADTGSTAAADDDDASAAAAGLPTGADNGRRLDDTMYLGVPSLTDASLAIDLWMLGAADHVMSASKSTLTTWASRSIERNGRPHAVDRLTQSAGNKVIPVCGSACIDGNKVSAYEYK